MNSTDFPLVSIVIPCYNRKKWIGQAIESCLAQDYPNLEVVVSDDASTDGSYEVIRQYASDPRLVYSRNEFNIGMVANYEKVYFEMASGEYATQVGSDDYLLSTSFISKSIQLIKKYPDVYLVFGKYDTLFEESGTVVANTSTVYKTEFRKGIEVFLEFPLHKTFGWGGALMHRKKFEEQEPLKTNISSMDHLANLKLMLVGNVGFIDESVYLFRVHSSQASQNLNPDQYINNFISISAPYKIASANSDIPKPALEEWRTELSYQYAKFMAIALAPNSKADYDKCMNYVKEHFPGGYKRLFQDLRWRVLIFFFRKPRFSLKFFSVFNRAKYDYLLSLCRK